MMKSFSARHSGYLFKILTDIPGVHLEMQPAAVVPQPTTSTRATREWVPSLDSHPGHTWVTLYSNIQSTLMISHFFPLSFEGAFSLPEGGHSPTSPSPQLEEMEPRLLEFEPDPPNWRESAPPEALSRLNKKETKRQEVINGEEKRDVAAQRWEGNRWTDEIRLQHLSFRLDSLLPLRVVCNWACTCADAKCPSDDLLQAVGERGAPDRHRVVRHLPEPGWDHWNALWVLLRRGLFSLVSILPESDVCTWKRVPFFHKTSKSLCREPTFVFWVVSYLLCVFVARDEGTCMNRMKLDAQLRIIQKSRYIPSLTKKMFIDCFVKEAWS